jgi:hypothetical protein
MARSDTEFVEQPPVQPVITCLALDSSTGVGVPSDLAYFGFDLYLLMATEPFTSTGIFCFACSPQWLADQFISGGISTIGYLSKVRGTARTSLAWV